MTVVRSVKTTRKHHTKQEKAVRLAVEETLKGKALPKKPPTELTTAQGEIYSWLYEQLAPAKILSKLDLVTMKNACIIIDRLQIIDADIEKTIEDSDLTLFAKLSSLRNTYFNQYLKVCNELCLSPSARAKMGTLAVSQLKEQEDPLVKALAGSGGGKK